MPRKRKAARAFRKPQCSVQARVREKFALGSLELILLRVEDFHKELPSEAERRAFADIHPGIFYELFGFEASAFDKYPASNVVAFGCCVFRRPNFMEFLKTNPARTPFTPPDLTDVAYRDQQAKMAAARMEWWRANKWGMTEPEHRFVLYGPVRRPIIGDPGPLPTRMRSPYPRGVIQ